MRNEITFNYYRYKDFDGSYTKAIKKLIESLYRSLSLNKNKKMNECLKQIVINCLIKGEFHISRNRDKYINSYISFSILISLLDKLEEEGYIKQEKGVWSSNKKASKETVINATKKLINLFLKGYLNLEKISKLEPKELIQLKTHTKENKSNKQVKYEDTRMISRMRNQLKKYNSFIANQEIKMYVENIEVKSEFKDYMLNLEKAGIIKINNLNNLIDISMVYNSLHRVFNNNSFKQGGRFYGASYQSFGKNKTGLKLRPYIKINENKVVCLDYSGLHINMLYNKKGLEYKGDPYMISGIPREYLKIAALVMLNAKSKKDANGALQKKLRKITGKSHKTKYIIDAFILKHSIISEYFCSNIGIKLQNIDSKIMNHILNDLTKQKIVALCVHDEVIVEEANEHLTRKLMNKYYKKIMNVCFNPIIK